MISIIIPTFNREKELKETIELILKQSYGDFEILVVDNGPSTDGTENLISNLKKRDKRIRYIQTSLKGVSYARSLGNKLVKGDVIIQFDDDTSLIDRNTLRNLNIILSENLCIDILGALELKHKDLKYIQDINVDRTFFKTFRKRNKHGQIDAFYNISTGFEYFIHLDPGIYPVSSFRSCFMAYRRSVLDKVKNFDLKYSRISYKVVFREETDFLLRAKNQGMNIYYTNLIYFLHRAAERDSSLYNRTKSSEGFKFKTVCHVYFAMRDMLDNKNYFKLVPWFFFQFFIGAYKNPGIYFAMRRKINLLSVVKGSFIGLKWGFRKRFFLQLDNKNYFEK